MPPDRYRPLFDLLQPLLLSLRITGAAVLLAACVAIPLAYFVRRRRFFGKSVLESLITVPLVLPPTVVGYCILMLLGARGWPGHYLKGWFDYSIVFRFEGAMLAAAVVALPLLYLPAKAAFASVDRELEDIARLMGAGRLRTFWHVSLPMARRGIASGLLLGFARALGEFGATLMVFGWREDYLTLPVSVYAHFESGDLARAMPAVMLLSVLSLALILLYNWSGAGKQE